MNLSSFPQVSGQVIPGNRRGRNLGFPTINFPLPKSLRIEQGIYASIVKIQNKLYKGATSVGAAETFGSTAVRVETFVLDFSGDAYDQEVSVYLVQKLREVIKFGSKEELITQIEKDVQQARLVLKGLDVAASSSR